MKITTLVEVVWRDAASVNEWHSPDKVTKFTTEDTVIFSVGWLCEAKKDKYIALVADLADDGDASRVIKIPKANVIKIAALTKRRKRK